MFSHHRENTRLERAMSSVELDGFTGARWLLTDERSVEQ